MHKSGESDDLKIVFIGSWSSLSWKWLLNIYINFCVISLKFTALPLNSNKMDGKAKLKKDLNIFETIRPLMVRFGVHSYNLSDPRNGFFKSFGCYYMFINAFLWMTISSAIFVYKHIADFEQVSEPCLVIFGGFQMGSMFFSLGLSGAKIKALHIELQNLIDQSIWILFLFSIFWNEKIIESSIRFLLKIVSDDAILNIYRDVELKCQKFERIVFYTSGFIRWHTWDPFCFHFTACTLGSMTPPNGLRSTGWVFLLITQLFGDGIWFILLAFNWAFHTRWSWFC